jgi:hypothetical protein
MRGSEGEVERKGGKRGRERGKRENEGGREMRESEVERGSERRRP